MSQDPPEACKRPEHISLMGSKEKELSFIPIVVSSAEGGEEETLLSPGDTAGLPGLDLKTLGLLEGDEEGKRYRIPGWNAFALSDPNSQLTVKSITSVGLGSTDGRNLYVRRVPSSASILISNNFAIRREAEEDEDDSGSSSVSSSESRYRFRRKHWRNKAEFILACIGFTVGLGNFWRFPYLCYKSGGGIFLIPYFIMLVVCAFPLLYMELAIGQFTRRGPVRALGKICPLFKGTGIASLVISFIMSTYSIVIIAWTLFYLVASFNSELPWQSFLKNITDFTNRTSATQEFYDRKVLQRTEGIEYPGVLRGELVICLFFAWILVYFSIWKSVRSSGRVVWFTTTFPYILLVAFIGFALTLPGANLGLRYFFRPQWELLLDAKVWVNAASQNFNSIGISIGSIITFSSYNRFSNDILTDTFAIGMTNAITSVLVGITVFAMLGNIAMEQNTTVDDVVADGPGLVFVVFPQALIKMPFPHVWAVLFFSMLLCVALDNEFAMVEVVVTSIKDGFPKFTEKYFKCHEVLVLVICVISFLLGLPNVLQGGIYIFQLIDQYAAAFSLMFLAFFEVIAVVWVYGAERLSRNIQEMTGKKASKYFINCLRFASPLLILVVWVFSFIDYEKPTYDNGKIEYPSWAEGLGWLISCSSLICIPVFAILQVRKSSGETFLEKLKSSIKSEIVECPKCNCTRNCNHELELDSEWNLHRSSIKATKLTPVIMSEAVYEKVSSL